MKYYQLETGMETDFFLFVVHTTLKIYEDKNV